MPLELYLAFLAATIVLVLMPGPNVALIVAASMARGAAWGLLTVAGTSSAMVLQLGLTCLGMTALLASLAEWFEWLRWIGAAYLVWLGLRAWSARAGGSGAAAASERSAGAQYLRGFLVSLGNPKTLLFYGAFLPQFVDASGDVASQLLLLSASFLAIAALLDGAWALLAAKLRAARVLSQRFADRLTGGVLIGAGVGLALARRT